MKITAMEIGEEGEENSNGPFQIKINLFLPRRQKPL